MLGTEAIDSVYKNLKNKNVYRLYLDCRTKTWKTVGIRHRQCWPSSVCKALRHERKSPESKSCLRSKSRKSEEVLITQTRTGEEHLDKERQVQSTDAGTTGCAGEGSANSNAGRLGPCGRRGSTSDGPREGVSTYLHGNRQLLKGFMKYCLLSFMFY